MNLIFQEKQANLRVFAVLAASCCVLIAGLSPPSAEALECGKSTIKRHDALQQGNFPYNVAIRYDAKDERFPDCAGVIINELHVLVPATCV